MIIVPIHHTLHMVVVTVLFLSMSWLLERSSLLLHFDTARASNSRTPCTVSTSISVQHVRCFSMVFLICAYVHFRLFLEFRGLKIANLKIRDGGRVKEFRPNLFLWFPAWSDVNSWSSVFLKILDDLGQGLDALTVQRVPDSRLCRHVLDCADMSTDSSAGHNRNLDVIETENNN